jgi:hypothetical protein
LGGHQGVWAVIAAGFGYRNIHKFIDGTLTYPWVVHVHAAFFVGWLVFFTVQILLVRQQKLSSHRRWGMAGAGLAGTMVVLGVFTGILTESLKFGTPDADARYLSVMFADMLVFASLIAAAILWRSHPAAHKRLILVATLVLTDAGFGRWLSPAMSDWIGGKNFWDIPTFAEAAWPFFRHQYLPAYVLMASVGLYDLATRRRLHPAYVAGVAWCVLVDLLGGWLYYQPFWNNIALGIIGHGP